MDCPEWKKDKQEFVRKDVPLEKCNCSFWKELQNWEVQRSVDVMYFKLRQTLAITVYEMRFVRTNSQFRLQCGYKPGRECEGVGVRGL